DQAAADAAVSAAIASGVMTSNDDNAAQIFSDEDLLAAPFWRAFIERTDFAVTAPFIELLKGDRGNFPPDPRLFEMAAPISADIEDIKSDSYERSEDFDDYIGIPYAFPNANFLPFTSYSFMSSKVLKPDYSEIFMEYSEVAFLLSEINGFSQDEYENGVRASMTKWGVAGEDIEAYVSALPPANEANVRNQKYIALYMQPNTAYTYYRKTGFPNTLIQVGEVYNLPPNQVEAQGPDNRIESFAFDAIPDIDDLPSRLTYPVVLQTLNGANRSTAASNLSNGDAIDSKLFWDND
ncbi:MAG: SusD/RagB family nutrient-binding outer membrane lipoprotein, partial [Pricia sp.]